MNKSTLSFLLLAVTGALLAGNVPAEAQLVWEKKEIHLEATPMDKEVTARYVFKNEGKEPVKFKAFKTACGCVSMTVSTMVVPPGEGGDLTVKFAPEYRIGTQKRPIAVEFDDEKNSKTALYLVVAIPEIVRPDPIYLKWESGEEISPKSVTIVTDEKYPVDSISVRTLHPHWKAKVQKIENSRNFTVEILPRRGPGIESRNMEVEAKLADGQIKRTNLYVLVR